MYTTKDIVLKEHLTNKKITQMKKFFKGKTLMFLDLETTGLKPDTDKIIQLSLSTLDLKEGVLKNESWMMNPHYYNNKLGRWAIKEIHPKATEVHGYTNENLINFPTLNELCCEIILKMEKADYIVTFNGYNFDIPFLLNDVYELPNGDYWEKEREVHKLNFIDVFDLYIKNNPKKKLNTLDDIYFDFNPEIDKDKWQENDFLTKIHTMLNEMIKKNKTLPEKGTFNENTTINNFFYNLNQEERYTLEALTNKFFPKNNLEFHNASHDNLATSLLLTTLIDKYETIETMFEENMSFGKDLKIYDHRMQCDLLYKGDRKKPVFYINYGKLKGQPLTDLFLHENKGVLNWSLGKNNYGYYNRNYNTRKMITYFDNKLNKTK